MQILQIFILHVNSAAGFVGYVGRNSVLKIKSSYNYGLIISMGNTANAFANSDESVFINCENSYYLSIVQR